VALYRPALLTYDLDFGNVDVGTSRAAFLGIQNTGDPGTAISGRFPLASGVFAGGGRAFSGLKPGDVRSEMYTFAPTSAGPFSQTLSVVSDAGTTAVHIRGNGASSCYANCDASTTPPVLNVADFTCFLQKFAQGCP
jgi:hypothetical protein